MTVSCTSTLIRMGAAGLSAATVFRSVEEVAEESRGIVSSLGGFFDGAPFVEVGSEGFALPHGQTIGLAKKLEHA